MEGTRIAFLAAFSPLRPGAEEIIIPFVEKTREFLAGLGTLIAHEAIVTTPDEGREAVRKLLSQNPHLFAVLVTGGTERIIQFAFRDVDLPLLILACARANSLPAALEMLPRLREMGKDVKLIFVKEYDPETRKAFEDFLAVRRVVGELRKTVLGIFGAPSPWLIGCLSDYKLLEDKFGFIVKHIELLTLYKEYQGTPTSVAEDLARQILSGVKGMREPSFETLVEATRLYLATRKIVEREQLNALTIKCFDMLPVVNNTMCLALSRLIDEGITAGCEGDLNALLSMLILHHLTGQPTWLANPVSLDYERNTLTLAHCTIAMKLAPELGEVVLRSHFESGIGVAIQSPVEKGKVTLMRMGGPGLDRMLVLPGEVVDSNMDYGYMCRTQVEVRLEGEVRDFVDRSLGNHLVLVPGDVVEGLRQVCTLFDIEPVVIEARR